MSSIAETIDRLSALRTGFGGGATTAASDRLTDLSDFGANPGALRARMFVPDKLVSGAALVVVLHGCTQTAAGYDHGSGWSVLAEQHGFALLFPEQQRANNPNLCFNWFAPGDARRDQGEASSIRRMTEAMVDRYDLDPACVFVTGLSAGGAMTAALLASYPEAYAGGAVIAGLPYGTAWSVSDALARMRGHGLPDDATLAALVEGASDHGGPWPTLSIWHGDVDSTVSPVNAEALLAQWRALHGVGAAPSAVQRIGGHARRVWRNDAGREVIEDYRVAGMGHGTPLDTAVTNGCGASGPHMLDVGLSSTRLIAEHWGLAAQTSQFAEDRGVASPPKAAKQGGKDRLPFAMPVPMPTGVERTINDALRAAGLLR